MGIRKAFALVAMAALLAACTSEFNTDGKAVRDGGTGGLAGPNGAGKIASAIDLSKVRRAPTTNGRYVIQTAQLTIETKQVVEKADAATRIVADAEGIVFSQNAELSGKPTVSMTLKVPPQSFDAVLRQLERLGKVKNRRIDTKDVTSTVIDLDARVGAARTSVDRLRELMQNTGSVQELVAAEQELAEREAQFESLQAQAAALTEQVELATISVVFRGETPEKEPKVDDDIPGFLKGLKTGLAAFANFFLVLLTAVGFVLPFAIPAALIALVVRRIMRARKREPDVVPAEAD